MIDIDKLKKFEAKVVDAPEVLPTDRRWSEIFEEVAKKFDSRMQPYGLCHAILTCDYPTSGQYGRMRQYIENLLGDCSHVNEWVAMKNNLRHRLSHSELHAYRAAWARHLASQFRAAGL